MPDPYFSEIKYLGNRNLDFIEVAVDEGTDVSNITVTVYNPNGSVRSVNSLGSLVNNEFGSDIYVIDTATSSTFNGLNKFGAISIDTGGTVHSFVSFNDGSPVTATAGAANGLTSTQIGQAGSGESLETTDDGSSYAVQTSPTSGSIPCFTTGTVIETNDGPKRVECLKVGQMIQTVEGQYVPLRWVGMRTVTPQEMRENPGLCPVRIKAGSLAPGLPNKDMLVSRQHRMLVRSKVAGRMFASEEVLLPAIKLQQWPGVRPAMPKRNVTYVHLLFDQHEVILANGAPSESFYTGRHAMAALSCSQLAEIAEIFPRLVPGNALGARPFVSNGKRTKRLIKRMRGNRKDVVEPARRDLRG